MKFSTRSKWVFLAVVALAGLGLDIGSKFLAVKYLPMGQPVEVLGKYLEFLLLYNRNAIFGLDPRALIAGFPVNGFFYVFSVIAISLLLLYYKSIKDNRSLHCWGIALILPGALGNFYDRVFFPARGVVDFIKMGISEIYYWPIYNFADVYITFGVIFVLIDMLRQDLRPKAVASAAEKSNA